MRRSTLRPGILACCWRARRQLGHNSSLCILVQPELSRIMGLGLDVAPATPDALGAFLEAELAKWERLVRDAGIQPE